MGEIVDALSAASTIEVSVVIIAGVMVVYCVANRLLDHAEIRRLRKEKRGW